MIMGWGNLGGIYAAELAEIGFGGPDTALEGDFGFYRTTSAKFDAQRLVDRLGDYHEILFTGIKPYACCRQHHAAIDCMLELREKHAFGLQDVEHVRVRTFVVSSRGNKKRPRTVPEAKYSIPYILAVTLKYGKIWREQFTDELIADEALLSFADRVDVEPDYELDKLYDEKWPSIVEVRLKDGRSLTARRDLPQGEPEFPCSEDALKDKFMSLAGDVLSPQRSLDLWNAIFYLEDIKDLNELSGLLRNC
jgi:2-methylcitrate dehydratase PrpD